MKILICTLFFSVSTLASEPTAERQQQLLNMLKHDCGSCHGLTRKGGLGPALLAESLKYKSNDFLVQTILKGRKGTAMAPWEPFISKQESVWLVEELLKK